MKIGDRVKAMTAIAGYHNLIGKKGTIVASRDGPFIWGIEFDKPFTGGHTCNERGKRGHCRWTYTGDKIEEIEVGPPKTLKDAIEQAVERLTGGI